MKNGLLYRISINEANVVHVVVDVLKLNFLCVVRPLIHWNWVPASLCLSHDNFRILGWQVMIEVLLIFNHKHVAEGKNLINCLPTFTSPNLFIAKFKGDHQVTCSLRVEVPEKVEIFVNADHIVKFAFHHFSACRVQLVKPVTRLSFTIFYFKVFISTSSRGQFSKLRIFIRG